MQNSTRQILFPHKKFGNDFLNNVKPKAYLFTPKPHH